jgi:hypothetical protein
MKERNIRNIKGQYLKPTGSNTRIIQRQIENNSERMSDKESEFDMQTKFVSWAVEMVSQRLKRITSI